MSLKSQVVCLNGHDVTGVEGFNCPACGAEVQTVLAPARVGVGARPVVLMVLGAMLLSLVIGLVAIQPTVASPLATAAMFAMGAGGAALWLAGCVQIALAIVRSPEGDAASPVWPPRASTR